MTKAKDSLAWDEVRDTFNFLGDHVNMIFPVHTLV